MKLKLEATTGTGQKRFVEVDVSHGTGDACLTLEYDKANSLSLFADAQELVSALRLLLTLLDAHVVTS